MDKDRQGPAQKRQAAIRIVEARPKRQKHGSAKDAAPSGGKPPLAAKSFTSRMVRKWRVFPYGRNIAVVVSAVMDKDRQGPAQKRQAAIRIVEARPKRQKHGSAKDAAPSGGKPPLAAKSGVPASSKAPEAAAGAGGSRPAKAVPPLSRVAEAAKAARALPSAGKRVADFATDICVEDYLRGTSLACVFFLIRWCVAGGGRGPACYGCACRGDRDGWHSAPTFVWRTIFVVRRWHVCFF